MARRRESEPAGDPGEFWIGMAQLAARVAELIPDAGPWGEEYHEISPRKLRELADAARAERVLRALDSAERGEPVPDGRRHPAISNRKDRP